MSKHLSEDQIAELCLERASAPSLQHIRTCSQCAGELERFEQTVNAFRQSIHSRIDEHSAAHPPSAIPISAQPAAAGILTWRWVLAAAAAFVLVIPFVTHEIQPQEVADKSLSEDDADALMKSVNLHLSRTMPAPMEPILVLLPGEQVITESGGLK
jgi:hypothetical protein